MSRIAGLGPDIEHVHGLGRQGHIASLAADDALAGPVHHHRVVDVRRPRQVVAPDPLAGEGGLGRFGKEGLAHLRIEAVRAHDQVVAATRPVGESDLHGIALVGQGLEGHAQAHVDAVASGRLGQDPMQSRPRHAEVRRIVFAGQLGAVFPHQGLAAPVLDLETRIGKAHSHRLVSHTQFFQGADHIGLDDDSDVVDGPGPVQFHQVHCDTLAAQADDP